MGKRSLVGSLHAHGCRQCHIRYQDACPTPAEDATCKGCRGLRVWQLLIDGAASKDCCIATARLVTKDEKDTYRLAGSHLWFICTVCKRTQPHDPRRWP